MGLEGRGPFLEGLRIIYVEYVLYGRWDMSYKGFRMLVLWYWAGNSLRVRRHMPKRLSEKEEHRMAEADNSTEGHKLKDNAGKKRPYEVAEVYIPDYVMYDFGVPERTDGSE